MSNDRLAAAPSGHMSQDDLRARLKAALEGLRAGLLADADALAGMTEEAYAVHVSALVDRARDDLKAELAEQRRKGAH